MATTMEWATVESPCVAELPSHCTCVYCATCDATNYGGSVFEGCPDCKGDLASVDSCYGDCYDFAMEDIADNIFPEAMARLGNPTYLKIDGRAMGWQRLQGYAITQGTWESLYNKLRINSDFTLRFTLAGDTFTVARFSHDEPTGAYFTINPTQTLSSKMSIDEAIASNLVDEYGCHKGCGEYFYACNCEVE